MTGARSAPLVFAPGESPDTLASLAEATGLQAGDVEERDFEDGEHKLRPVTEVRGRDVYVVRRLAGDTHHGVNDKLMRLFFFLCTLRDAGAARVTVLAPYLPYARKDRRTKARDPVTLRYLAQLFEATRADRLVTLDVHNVAAFENAFRCQTMHLEAGPLFAGRLARLAEGLPVAVVSPDVGGAKRAERLRAALEEATGRTVGSVFLEKYRSEDIVSGEAVVGRVEGCLAVIVDDLIASGTTMLRAVNACHQNGAARVVAVATHGLFTAGAEALLEHPALERMLVTNSVIRPPPAAGGNALEVLAVEPMLGDAIRTLAGVEG